MDWETWLRKAAEPPSNSEEDKTESTKSQIERALNSHHPLADLPWRVYVKGSYANNTNVRLNYDADIAVEYYGSFYYDLEFGFQGYDPGSVGITPATVTYTRQQFKTDIFDALKSAFGDSAIEAGNVAYRVREKKTTLPADVVPCWEYRRYDGVDGRGEPIVHVGSRVYPRTGPYRNNFPQIQRLKGVEKNNITGRRYKRLVRALKKLQTRMVEEGKLNEELASYFTECLVYNVPNSNFGNSNVLDDMQVVLATIYNSTLKDGNSSDWTHVHELMYLFRGGFTTAKSREMASAAWDYLGFD